MRALSGESEPASELGSMAWILVVCRHGAPIIGSVVEEGGQKECQVLGAVRDHFHFGWPPLQ